MLQRENLLKNIEMLTKRLGDIDPNADNLQEFNGFYIVNGENLEKNLCGAIKDGCPDDDFPSEIEDGRGFHINILGSMDFGWRLENIVREWEAENGDAKKPDFIRRLAECHADDEFWLLVYIGKNGPKPMAKIVRNEDIAYADMSELLRNLHNQFGNEFQEIRNRFYEEMCFHRYVGFVFDRIDGNGHPVTVQLTCVEEDEEPAGDIFLSVSDEEFNNPSVFRERLEEAWNNLFHAGQAEIPTLSR